MNEVKTVEALYRELSAFGRIDALYINGQPCSLSNNMSGFRVPFTSFCFTRVNGRVKVYIRIRD